MLLMAGAAHAQDSLDDVLVPIVEQRTQGKLDDARYEKKILAALKGHKVAPLWALGFALRKKPIGSRAVRVRHEVNGVAMVLPPLVWSQHATADIGMPDACSYGCCGFESRDLKVGAIYVTQACFAKGELTDLDFGVVTAPDSDTAATELYASEAIPKWLSGTDRVALATALAEVDDVMTATPKKLEAIRTATTRPVEVAAWRAVTAFANKPTADQPFVATLHSQSSRPPRRKVASWNELVAQAKLPIAVATPLLCVGACCLLSQPAEIKQPWVRDVCFDDHDRLRRVNVDVDGVRSTIPDWILQRVREDAKTSNWSPATRVDACLAAALSPQTLEAVYYCAQRAGPDKARQRELLAYVRARVQSSFKELDGFDYDAYWLGSATDPRDREVRRTSLAPLAKIAVEGAVLWENTGLTESRRMVKTAADVVKRYRVPMKDDGTGGSRFYDVPSVLPYDCRGSCCRYKLTTTTPCTAGGGPDNFILHRACFDASGATTDLFVSMESEADPVYHPDAP